MYSYAYSILYITTYHCKHNTAAGVRQIEDNCYFDTEVDKYIGQSDLAPDSSA